MMAKVRLLFESNNNDYSALMIRQKVQRWARYFFKVPAVPVLENPRYFCRCFSKKFQKESRPTAPYFVDF